jgi:hypothetical protein
VLSWLDSPGTFRPKGCGGGDPYDPAIAQAVAVQPVDLLVVERVRRGLLAAWEQLEDADDAEFRSPWSPAGAAATWQDS